MKLLKKMLAVLALAPTLAMANSGGYPLDRAPEVTKLASLQNGAKLFVNYCLNCHSATSMRYNRLRDLGLTEEQIKENLLFTGEKVGELMTTTMNPKDAKKWFGAAPPDLSVIARARSSSDGTGADWLYTYLRTFYKDDTRPSGWNNMVFNNVGMPHALWELQGIQEIKQEKKPEAEASASAHAAASAHTSAKAAHETHGLPELVITKTGKMNKTEYDTAVADLVGYMSWMAEPVQAQRRQLGGWVLMFMSILALLAWRLNASFWKEVK